MGLVYVVADQQCVLVFASHRHSSYRFGFLRVGPRRPSPVVYNTVRGTVERPRRRGPRGSDTARGSNAVWSSSTTTRSRRRRSETARRHPTPACTRRPHGPRRADPDAKRVTAPGRLERAGTCAKPKDEKPSRAESPQSSHLRATVARRRPALGPA